MHCSRALGTLHFLGLNKLCSRICCPLPWAQPSAPQLKLLTLGHSTLDSPTLGNKSILVPQSPAQADDRVREISSYSFPPICYMLTGNQLGNHRENMAVLGRGGWKEALSLLGIKSADISPRLIQALVTATLHHFLLIFSENSSKVPRSFSPG